MGLTRVISFRNFDVKIAGFSVDVAHESRPGLLVSVTFAVNVDTRLDCLAGRHQLTPGNALLDIPLVEVSLLGHSVECEAFDVTGGPLVIQHLLDPLNHFLLQDQQAVTVKSKANTKKEKTCSSRLPHLHQSASFSSFLAVN